MLPFRCLSTVIKPDPIEPTVVCMYRTLSPTGPSPFPKSTDGISRQSFLLRPSPPMPTRFASPHSPYYASNKAPGPPKRSLSPRRPREKKRNHPRVQQDGSSLELRESKIPQQAAEKKPIQPNTQPISL